jgi:two-component sensor histidine kinase/CheY-like chemotaxis protein
VDDEADNRYLLKSLLTGSGYEVAEAPNGKKALEMLDQGTWDLVISDILMPVMDGYQLCREIRSNEKLRHLPFIFYTATYIDQKDEEFAMKLGADRFYRKPLDPRVFLEHIRKFMEEIAENRDLQRPAIQGSEKEILKLYSERLINKLEMKMKALEKEVAERKRGEERLEAALKEKEALLREIHHRVKNNMQIISSLISLPTRRLEDPAAEEMLRQIKLRIRSMALVHEKLYQSKDLARINFGEFLRDLAVHHFQFFQIDSGRITLKTETEGVMLPIEIAVPCGLIAGELVSNALKHALPGTRRGEIVVGLKRLAGEEILLSVRDDGVGFPKGLDFRKAETMGMVILTTLTSQIDGRVELLRDGGTEFRVSFPAPAT